MTGKHKADQWIEFSLEVAPELADPTAEALAGIFPGGLVRQREFRAVFPDQLDQVAVPVRILGYFPADQESDLKERIAQALASVQLDLPIPAYSFLEDKNWAAAWQDRYHPLMVGERLMIVPSWLENPEPDRTAVFIDPGMAFGSGTHPTTRLTLELLERSLLSGLPPLMIDVGCGSGILSIAAAKLGVRKVLGVDNDPDAIRVSGKNAIKNQTSAQCDFKEWSVPELLDQKIESQLVVANIIAPILETLFSEGMADLVTPGGVLVLSGILQEQLSGIKDHLQDAGFLISFELEEEGWYALLSEKTRRN
jgi:ribosomal protein L11 methyltransferase